MPFFIVGGKVSLSANGEDTLQIRVPTDMRVTRIAVYADGKAEISDMELVGAGRGDLLDGVIVVDQLRKNGYGIDLPEPLEIPANTTFQCKVKDLSGSTNNVYIALMELGGR